MRPFARALCAALLLLPALGRAQTFFMESPVALALISSVTGAESADTRANGQEIFRASRINVRITTATLLDLLVEQEVIPARRGWRLIAVWATWPEVGNSYRFYVQNLANRADVREVPTATLNLEILTAAVSRKHTSTDDAIVSGTETYKVYARLRLGDYDNAGLLLGFIDGTARYARPAGSPAAYYVPGASRFTGAGVLASILEGGPASRILEGDVRFGAATTVPASRYDGSGGSYGSSSSSSAVYLDNFSLNAIFTAEPISDHLSGLTKTGSGTLHFSDNASYSGSVTVATGTLSGTFTSTGSTLLNDFPLLNNTLTIAPGTTVSYHGTTFVSGSELVFPNGSFAAFDLANLPPGFDLTDGILTYTAPAAP